MTWGGHVAPQDAVACSLTELHFIARCIQVLVKGLMPALSWTEEVAGASSGASPWVSHHGESPKQALVYSLAGGSGMSTLILYLRSLQHPVVNAQFHALRSITRLLWQLGWCFMLCCGGLAVLESGSGHGNLTYRYTWNWTVGGLPSRMLASASLSVALCRFPLCWGWQLLVHLPFLIYVWRCTLLGLWQVCWGHKFCSSVLDIRGSWCT
jgi:hypothetical protein